MNLFIIGDVHGCFHTFSQLLESWNPATEHLIQVGDLVDRGAHSPETVALAVEVDKKHPETTTFLMGNHEDAMLRHFGIGGPSNGWLNFGGKSTLAQYKQLPGKLDEHLPWISQRPLLWKNEHVLVSHAGISPSPHAYDPDSQDGLLWARGTLKRLEHQLQVVGHTPLSDGEPLHDPESHTLYIDTGAVFGGNLTGIRLSPAGEVLDIILIPVDPEDLL